MDLNAHKDLYRSGHHTARGSDRCCSRNFVADPRLEAHAHRARSFSTLKHNQERIRTLGIFAGAQGGQYITALSGLEIALWDLAGKALGLPVYQLLGGKFRDKVRIYCDSDMEAPIGEEADRKLPWIKAQGFTAMKIDLDDARDPARFDTVNFTASNGEIDRMVKWVSHVRRGNPSQYGPRLRHARSLRCTNGGKVAQHSRAIPVDVARGETGYLPKI